MTGTDPSLLGHATSSDGVPIAVTSIGDGPALVWLPPFPFSNVMAQWRIPFVGLAGSLPALFVEDREGDMRVIIDFLTGEPNAVHANARPSATPHGLSAREHEVLALIAGGEANAEIAHRLGISVHTVERHAANLYRKIGARNRADATAYALRHRLD
jgi:DNA-binding CsgD family transcriptional regulator